MKSSAVFLGAVLAFVTAAKPAHADDATKVAMVEEMLRLTRADQMVQQVMAQLQPIMTNQIKQMNLPPEAASATEEIQKKLMALLEEKLSWQKLKPLYVKLYADNFTEQELSDIVTFYKTPGGSALLEKMPTLLAQSMRLAQSMITDFIPEISTMVEEVTRKYPRK